MAHFARAELEELVDELEQVLHVKTQAPDLVGALILAARRLPLEIVRELLPAYVARERAERERSVDNPV